jgi:hypothetical protein
MTAALCNDMGMLSEDTAIYLETSRSYVNNAVTECRNDPKSREKYLNILQQLPDWYRSRKKAELPKLAEAESRALDMYLEKPQLLISNPSLARQLRSAGGIATTDLEGVSPISQYVQVNIQQIIHQQQSAGAKQITSDEIVDVED